MSIDAPSHRRNAVCWLYVAARAITLSLLVDACSSADTRKAATVYDIVILNGRVMDPASGFDSSGAVGITVGSIRAIREQPLQGRDTIDARGMIVAPGFIDLHQHAQDSAAYRVEVLDGTTTALELESGTVDVDRWYRARAGRSIINHGVSVGHEEVRRQVLGDTGKQAAVGPAKTRASTPAELAEILAAMDRGLQRGAVAAGMLIEFTPGATPWEILEVFRVAAKHGAAVHVHMRGLAEAYYFLETEEVIAASAATGASAHIAHPHGLVPRDFRHAVAVGLARDQYFPSNGTPSSATSCCGGRACHAKQLTSCFTAPCGSVHAMGHPHYDHTRGIRALWPWSW